MGRGRQRMEERFGPLGAGRSELTIAGERYDLRRLLRLVGMDYEDVRPIDAHDGDGAGRFVLRYVDLADRAIVAYEFDAAFRYLGELRVHLEEWMGEDYFTFPWIVACPEAP